MSLTRKALLAAFAAVAAWLLAFGLSTAPAAATDPNSGSLDTSVTYIDSSDVGTLGDECTGNKCKKIPWCEVEGKTQAEIAAEAPVVMLTDGEDPPHCVKKPTIGYKKCVVGSDGKIGLHVKVTNDNAFKMKVKVWLDNGTPVTKWVNGDSSATYEFANVGNGWHTIHASVWAGGNTWCHFKEKRVEVKCASPSPSTSTSPSPSVSPSASVSPSTSTSPAGQLPQTGSSSVGPLVTAGVASVGAGGILLFLLRRRRNFTIE